MAETADGWVPKTATKNSKTSSNIQSIDGEANTDTSQLLLKELEHVISLIGPAKEEITHLQQEFTKHQVIPKLTSSEDVREMHCQLDNAKRECAKLQEQIMQEKVKTEAQYNDKLGELQSAYTKIRELEVYVKDREDKMRARHKEEIDAYKDVNHTNEKLLQSALKQVKEKEERERQLERAYTNDIKKQQQEITKLTALLESVKQEKGKLEKDLSDTQSRLSKLMGDKLSDNNPDIADLSDNNRPTKLAEKYQELYDNQWTDAYEIAEKYFRDKPENVRIHVLIQILMRVYKYCKKETAEQDKELLQAIYRTYATEGKSYDVPVDVKTNMKEIKRFADTHVITNLTKRYIESLDTTKTFGAFIVKVEDFVQSCMTVCWPMVRQDPPLALHLNVQKGELFDSSKYKHYTATGTIVDFVVWPALLLYQDGPILCKGVVQCTKQVQGSTYVKVRSRQVDAAGIGIPTGSIRLSGTETPVDTTKWFSDGISQAAEDNTSTMSSADTNSTNTSEQTQIQPNETTVNPLDQQEFARKQDVKQEDENASKDLNTEPNQQAVLNVPQTQKQDPLQHPGNSAEQTETDHEKNHPLNHYHRSDVKVHLHTTQHGATQQSISKYSPNSRYEDVQQKQSTTGSNGKDQSEKRYKYQSQPSAFGITPTTDDKIYQNPPAVNKNKQNQHERVGYQKKQPESGSYQLNSQYSTQPASGSVLQNQPAYSQFPEASSSIDHGLCQHPPGNSRANITQYPAHLIPTQVEYDSYLRYNNYYRYPNLARYWMGAQLYDKCTNYIAWQRSRQYTA